MIFRLPFSSIIAELLQLLNTERPISLNEAGITNSVNPVQPEKTPGENVVTEEGITNFVNPVHPEKAELFISVTDEGILVFLH